MTERGFFGAESKRGSRSLGSADSSVERAGIGHSSTEPAGLGGSSVHPDESDGSSIRSVELGGASLQRDRSEGPSLRPAGTSAPSLRPVASDGFQSAGAPIRGIGRTRPAPPESKREWLRRNRRRLLWWLVEAVAAIILGVLLFDRVLMPAVVRHGDEVAVPDLTGLPTDRAREEIEALGLQAVISQGEFDPSVPAGTVMDMSPGPGVAVKEGRQVFLTPSLGKENRVVPDLHGLSIRLATMKLEEVGLRVGSTDQAASDAIPPGQILASNPPAGAPVPVEGSVSLLVSRRKAPIPLWMPDLTGRAADETSAWLESCGFNVRIEETSLPGDEGSILEQDPLPGAPIWPGSLVRLTAVSEHDPFDFQREERRSWRR